MMESVASERLSCPVYFFLSLLLSPSQDAEQTSPTTHYFVLGSFTHTAPSALENTLRKCSVRSTVHLYHSLQADDRSSYLRIPRARAIRLNTERHHIYIQGTCVRILCPVQRRRVLYLLECMNQPASAYRCLQSGLKHMPRCFKTRSTQRGGMFRYKEAECSFFLFVWLLYSARK